MKFKVKSGEVKDCIQQSYKGVNGIERKYWVTPKRGWLVARINDDETLTLADKREVHIEEPEEEQIVLPTMDNLVAEIKEFMDLHGIAYNSSDTKADLLQKIDWHYTLQEQA